MSNRVGRAVTSAVNITSHLPRTYRFLVGLAVLLGAVVVSNPTVALATTNDQSVAYQLDTQHEGDLNGETITTPLTQLWAATVSGSSSYPLIANGVVYVTAGNTSSGSGTTLYAFNQSTGVKLWSHSLGGSYAWSGLAYDAGQIYTVNNNGTLAAYNATTGAADWSTTLTGQYQFSSPPTASNGFVYTAGAGSGGTIYAVAESTGALVWDAAVENGDDSSPAVDDGQVFVGYAGNQVYAFDAISGALNWHYAGPTEGGGGATTVVGGGNVFTRDSGNNLILSEFDGTSNGSYSSTTAPAIGAADLYTLSGSTLTAIAEQGTGSDDWTFAGDGDLDTAPLVVGNATVGETIFEGSSSGHLYALDDTGATLWSTNVGVAIPAPDERNLSQPLTGLGAGEGTIIVPAGSQVIAYKGANAGTGIPTDVNAPTSNATPLIGDRDAVDVGEWTAVPSAYTYQWERCNSAGAACAAIASATGESYTPLSADLGFTLRVSVTATNTSGTSAAVLTAPSAVVTIPPPSNLTDPIIGGTPTVGSALTTTNGTWTGSPTSYTYQWSSCNTALTACNNIAGATQSTYTPATADVGLDLFVAVVATNAAGPSTADYSVGVGPVVAATTIGATPLAWLLPPTITGSPSVGATLTTTTGSWNKPVTFAYQWLSCTAGTGNCALIAGATGNTYVPTVAVIGDTIAVNVIATSGAQTVTKGSNPTAAVTAALPVPAPPTPAPVPAPTPTNAPPSPTVALAALGVRLGSAHHISDLEHHGLTAIVRCTAACGVSMALDVVASDKGLKGSLASTTGRLKANQTKDLNMTPPKHDDKAMSALATLTIDLVVAVDEPHSNRRYVDVMTIPR